MRDRKGPVGASSFAKTGHEPLYCIVYILDNSKLILIEPKWDYWLCRLNLIPLRANYVRYFRTFRVSLLYKQENGTARYLYTSYSPRVSTYRSGVHLPLVRIIISTFIRQRLKISKLRNFQTKNVSQFNKDKVCWSETIFSFWFSNVFPIQIWDRF